MLYSKMNCLLQCSHAALLAIRIKSSHWALVALKGKRMQKSEPPHAIITTCHCATHPAQHAFIASPYASPPATCTFFISPLPPSDVSAVNSCIARVEERREWGLCMAQRWVWHRCAPPEAHTFFYKDLVFRFNLYKR